MATKQISREEYLNHKKDLEDIGIPILPSHLSSDINTNENAKVKKNTYSWKKKKI